MKKIDKVNKSLKTILKKGDLYDVIALREGVLPRTHPFSKIHILFLSRILYGGVLIYEKIKSLRAPINEIKKIQEEIRNELGVNIDIVKSKQMRIEIIKPFLSVLYEDDSINDEEYTQKLQKIFNFCERHAIDTVLLRECDIANRVAIPSSEFKIISMTKVLNKKDGELNYNLLELNRDELRDLITKLDVMKINKNFLLELKDNIDDLSIKKAIDNFLLLGDLKKLKSLVNSRLNLKINSDGCYKDRNGRFFENVNIRNENIQVISANDKGENVSNVFTNLYNYLAVIDFNDLLKKSKLINDDKELFNIAALYLYLCNNVKNNSLQEKNRSSFYDRILAEFEEKKKDSRKQISGLYTKKEIRRKNLTSTLTTLILTAAILLYFSGSCGLIDISLMLLNKSSDFSVSESFWEKIHAPYEYSLNLEIEFLKNTIDTLKSIVIKPFKSSNNGRVSVTGESGNKKNNDNSDEIVATVRPLKEFADLPNYYASGYSQYGTYNKGAVEYRIRDITVLKYHIPVESIDPLFEIVMPISHEELERIMPSEGIFDYSLRLPLAPVGDDYRLANFCVFDKADNSIIYYENFKEINSIPAKAELEIQLVYGIGYMNHFILDVINITGTRFTAPVSDDQWLAVPNDTIRNAIIKGLGLSEKATNEEMFAAVQKKFYSKTPLRNAGINRSVKKLNFAEYIETVASLDSLICNLAATLAVGIDSDLKYVVGYLDEGNGVIFQKDAHAWAMDSSGEIIDITPNVLLEDDNKLGEIIDKIVEFAIEHNIAPYLLSATIATILYILFGKKVMFKVKFHAAEKLLTDSDTSKAFAKVNETLYGGINIPIKRTPAELISAIDNEFRGYSKEELQAIKKKLRLDESLNKEIIHDANKLVNQVPFIVENADVIKKSLRKK